MRILIGKKFNKICGITPYQAQTFDKRTTGRGYPARLYKEKFRLDIIEDVLERKLLEKLFTYFFPRYAWREKSSWEDMNKQLSDRIPLLEASWLLLKNNYELVGNPIERGKLNKKRKQCIYDLLNIRKTAVRVTTLNLFIIILIMYRLTILFHWD